MLRFILFCGIMYDSFCSNRRKTKEIFGTTNIIKVIQNV